MKKAVPVIIYILYVLIGLTFLMPIGKLLCLPFGYTFKINHIEIFTFLLAFLTVCTAGLSYLFKAEIENKTLQILIATLTPLVFVNSAMCIIESPTPFVLGNCAIYIISAFILAAKFESPTLLKIVSMILSILMIYPMIWFCLIAFFVGGFSEMNIVESVDSPNGKYRAEVILSDQGALGGDTFVEVYRKGIDAFIFTICGTPERVYRGDWTDYMDLNVYWKDENCLVIGSCEHFFD